MLKHSYAHEIGAKMDNSTLNGVRVNEQPKKKIIKGIFYINEFC